MSNIPNNPFFNPDFTKFMDMSKMMDPSKFGDFSKMMNQCKAPNFDVESMMASQRKNLEALANTNQKAFEGLQSYFTKQAELARESFEATTKLVNAVVAAPTPEEKVSKQIEATKSNIETCVASLKELSDILSHNQTKTMEIMTNAVYSSIDELQGMVKKSTNSSSN